MRILMISDVYFPRINGVSTSIQTFATEFSEQGHQITLIVPDYGPVAQQRSWALRKGTSVPVATPRTEHTDDESESFEIIRIAARYIPLDTEDRLLRMGRIRPLTPRLAAQDYDLVHIQTPFIAHYAGVKLARRLKIPVVESYHTFFEQYVDKYITWLPPSWLRLAARRVSTAQCRNLDALVVPSRAMQSVLEAYGVRTPTRVIPTGVKLEQFSQGDGGRFRRRYGIPTDRPVLIHIGRLAFEKNVDFLLRMLVRAKHTIPDVLLVIAGEGPARRRLEALGAELGLHEQLLFVGYLSRDGELEDCYRAGDGFIFASRTETQGLVLLEAMALGVPVVSTAVMGTQEVLEGGEGCLIAADDEADFAAKTVRLLSDSNLRARLGKRARAYAQTWSAKILADRMLAFYRTLVFR